MWIWSEGSNLRKLVLGGSWVRLSLVANWAIAAQGNLDFGMGLAAVVDGAAKSVHAILPTNSYPLLQV
jgi:hypothetical protein